MLANRSSYNRFSFKAIAKIQLSSLHENLRAFFSKIFYPLPEERPSRR
jgi:hypothetical protein